MRRSFALYPPIVYVRGELLDQAMQTISASDSLTGFPNPLHLHRTQRRGEKFLCNFWKNRRRRACAGKQNKSVGLVNAVLSVFKHPALKTAGCWCYSWAKYHVWVFPVSKRRSFTRKISGLWAGSRQSRLTDTSVVVEICSGWFVGWVKKKKERKKVSHSAKKFV